ncbi:hypothetical protein [Haloferula sp.]|uniref:hypothetical protein n=1 Tax=Haloferula sp. TaxID=2497595 RepID=UPI003C73136A
MKSIQTALKMFAAIAIATFMTNCGSTSAPTTGSMALDAGFKSITATTPAQKAELAKLPAGQVSSVTHKGKQYYVVPNADKTQAYIGGPAQYQRYKDLQADAQVNAANMEAIGQYGTGYDTMGAGSAAAWDAWGATVN